MHYFYKTYKNSCLDLNLPVSGVNTRLLHYIYDICQSYVLGLCIFMAIIFALKHICDKSHL